MSKRHAIIELHRAGASNSMIIKQLKVPKSSVYDTVARFKELGDDEDHMVYSGGQIQSSK